MTKKFARILLACLALIGCSLTFLIFTKGFPITALMVALLWGASLIIFFASKAYPYRFMYPGLITFIAFTVLPMIFTIYIGFTNLSTGHVLSPAQVFEILESEEYIPGDATPYSYSIFTKEESTTIAVTDPEGKVYVALVNTKDKDQILDLEESPLPNGTPLTRGAVFQIYEKLNNLSFKLPTGKILRYYRTHALIEKKKRYQEVGDGKLMDQLSNEVYYQDHEKGFYTNGTAFLAPGFYTKVGFKNFFSLFTDDRLKGPFLKVLTWTLLWASISVFLAFCVGMFLAILVNDEKLKGRAVYRLFLIIPYSIPFFISVIIFRGLLNKDFGAVNEALSMANISAIPWLDDPFWAKVSCLMVNLWLGFPYMFLVITGILQSIPSSIYEAALLDGANAWQKFRRITLPLIMVAIAPLLVGSFAFNLNNFVGIYLLTGGMPPIQGAMTPVGETDILISYTYRLAFEGGRGQDFGLASSISILIFIVIAILTLINFKLSGMTKEEKR